MAIIVSYPIPNIADMPLPSITKESLVIFPTETVYGIGTFISNEDGLESIYELKGRENKPLSLHIANPAEVDKYVEYVSPVAERAMALYSPGPLLMIFTAKKNLKLPGRLLMNGKIGVRVFSNFIGASLINMVNEPLVATSANLSGEKSPRNFFEVPEELIDGCDYAFDNGPTVYQKDSSVIDFSSGVPVLLREGAVPYDELKSVLCADIRRV